MVATQRIFGIARSRPDVTWEDMVPVMQVEAAHVWSLYEQNVLREAWVRTDALGAVYALETTPDVAAPVLSALPMAGRGLVDFELVPVGPFTSLSLLFGTQAHPVPADHLTRPVDAVCGRVLALGRLVPNVELGDLIPYLADETRLAWGLWKGGMIRENYLRTDRPGAALMLEAAGVVEARRVLARLPLVQAGLIAFECISLAAFMGFDALLEGSLDDVPTPLANPTVNTNR